MTTVVAGANGLIGSRVVARLLESGERVIGLGRGPQRAEGAFEYVEADLLLEPDKLRHLIDREQPSGVINAAAMTDVDGCEKRPSEAWAVNAAAVEIAAHACANNGARLTTVSTDYVFDGMKGSYSEDDAPNPRSIYARTKHIGEEAALILADDVAVCRTALVYSARRGVKWTFPLTVLESLRAGKQVKAFTDQIGSPTLADNAAEMVIGVHRSGARGIFHCAGATEISRVDFCRALARKLGADEALIVPVRLAEMKLPAPRPLKCGLRVDKVRGLLGPSVPLPLEAAMDRFLAERPQ